jgi:DNA polymerase delta subunit 1
MVPQQFSPDPYEPNDALDDDGFEVDVDEAAYLTNCEPVLETTGGALSGHETDQESIEFFRRLCGRPAARTSLLSASESLLFNQVTCDYVVERHRAAEPHTTVRVYGVTLSGESVLLCVQGFAPYFYASAPKGFGDGALGELRAELEHKCRTMGRVADCAGDCILGVERVRRRSVLYYKPGEDDSEFLRITVRTPDLVRVAAGLLSQGSVLGRMFDVFESSVDFVLRFMIDTKMMGCSWIEVPAGSYTVVSNALSPSYAQIVAEAHWQSVVCHPPSGEWLRTAAFRILSFDIECAGRKGIFPEPENDSVIQIGCHLGEYGKTEPLVRAIFTLGSCAPVAGVQVISLNREQELLQSFRNFLVAADPDIITGYNIVNFDLPYLLNRASAIGASRFPCLGRMCRERTTMRRTRLSSSAFGTHESMTFSIEGRVIMDMLQVIIRDHKLRSYSLNSVSSEFLNEQKEDVHYSIITDLQAGNEHTRRRLAVYCLKDAYLPLRLMDKLMSLTNYMELARVTGVPLDWLLSRGHMVKVVSLLHRKAHEADLLVPDLPRTEAGGRSGDGGPQYEGATVIEPKKGFYRTPIATMDFASLYPSIMMAYNLCYSTLVHESDVPKLKPDDYIRTPLGHCFVKPSVRKGILSEMLEEFLASRKAAKRDMQNATDPFLREVLNGRQLALKISANAVYGFTGASVGKLPCMEISASVTSYGRNMIELTRSTVERLYPGAEVIYGDTDSVMVKFNDHATLEQVMELGREAAKQLTNIFPPPVRLEFEKVYYPYLLISKKRYAGLYWTRLERHDKMDCKGIESVRRDNCRLVANVVDTVLQKLLIEQDVDGAIEFVKKIVSDLLQNRIDLSLLVVSKTLTRATTDYEAKQAHVFLVEKLRKRDSGSAPSLGDRVPYVIIKGATKNEKAYTRAEDPIYVLENSIPIDAHYYLENMLRKPLERIFSAVMKRPETLFSGAHTRSIQVATPRTGSGIMKFAKFRLQCVRCRAGINEAELQKRGLKGSALCEHCRDFEAETYLRHLKQTAELEQLFSALWTQCQECMGSCIQDVLCSNGDCPIFYRRRKVQKDITEAQTILGRFGDVW